MARPYGMIENIGEDLGTSRTKLDLLGLAENTIFISVTDNGTGPAGWLNEGGWKGHTAGMRTRKGSAHDCGHGVPFLAHWPEAEIGGGRDVDRLATGIDVDPTLVELADPELPKPIEFDGRSLAPLLRDEPGRVDGGTQFAQHPQTYVNGKGQMDDPQPYLKSAVLGDRWRLVDGKELYEVKADPGQANDVATESAQGVVTLRAPYGEWWAQVSGPAHEHIENPIRQIGFDWRPNGGPANHAVKRDPDLFREYDEDPCWAVRVAESGRYRFTLMDRQPEADYPIEGVEARITSGPFTAARSMPSSARSVRFETELAAGSSELWSWFDRADDASRGEYFVNLERSAH